MDSLHGCTFDRLQSQPSKMTGPEWRGGGGGNNNNNNNSAVKQKPLQNSDSVVGEGGI